MEIHLETRDGRFVSYATIPPMTPPPEMVLWGERTFVQTATHDEHVCQIYREGITWFIKDATPRSTPTPQT